MSEETMFIGHNNIVIACNSQVTIIDGWIADITYKDEEEENEPRREIN